MDAPKGLGWHEAVDKGGKSGSDQRGSATYRADIDGLRALAVLPIVAFHLEYPWIGGGYIGVDIFFVISGYLIGGGILRQIREERYAIADFYFRRFRRIAPALVATLILTTLICWFTLLPNALKDYAKTLVTTTLFGSNIWFWTTANYFSADAKTMPLLHTWSLAVEEQFYVVFPLLMLALRRAPMRLVHGVIVVLALLSFVASVVLLKHSPGASFYLLPTRFWELLIGVIAAEVRVGGLRTSGSAREGLAWAGVVLIGGALFLLRPDTPFPGMAALPPCLGTAMLLVAGAHGGTSVGRLLALPPLTFFGLISYSLYLWHWPVIVLALQAVPLAALDHGWRIGLFALSVLLAWGQWRLVERPWRAPSIQPRTIFIGSALSGALLCALGGALYLTRGAPARFDPAVVRVASVLRNGESNDFRRACMLGTGDPFAKFDQRQCLGRSAGHPNVLIFGDSHAAHLWSGLQDRYPHIHFLQATASSCKPMLDRSAGEMDGCARLMDFMFHRYLPEHQVDWVLVAGAWEEDDEVEVGRTIDWLKARGMHVVLAGPIVRYTMDMPLLAALAIDRGDPQLPGRFRRVDAAALDARFASLAATHGVLYFSTYSALCARGVCRTLDDAGLPIQFDYGHLTRAGARIVAARFPAAAVLNER